jgi:hypothetical protein
VSWRNVDVALTATDQPTLADEVTARIAERHRSRTENPVPPGTDDDPPTAA